MSSLNTARVIQDNAPKELLELEEERRRKLEEVYQLDVKIAHLRTQLDLATLHNPEAGAPTTETPDETNSRRSS